MIKSLLESDSSLPDALEIGGQKVPVTFRRNTKARRYILRFQQPHTLVATIPRGGSRRDAWQFIMRSQAWVRRQMEKLPATAPVWGQGTEVWLRGEKLPLEVAEHFARLGSEIIPLRGDLKSSVLAHLRDLASAELIPRTHELAAQEQTAIAKVAVKNQRSRWGSCSIRRTISLNWRLIQIPAFVRDYIILHELMHLRQMNHSAKFWAEVESVCPTWREAESWLRRHGREIMSCGE